MAPTEEGGRGGKARCCGGQEERQIPGTSRNSDLSIPLLSPILRSIRPFVSPEKEGKMVARIDQTERKTGCADGRG